MPSPLSKDLLTRALRLHEQRHSVRAIALRLCVGGVLLLVGDRVLLLHLRAPLTVVGGILRVVVLGRVGREVVVSGGGSERRRRPGRAVSRERRRARRTSLAIPAAPLGP